MYKQSNNKGFSIVELVVVMAIIVVAISVFSISFSVISSNNVRRAANDVEALLTRGKINSNYRNRIVYLEIDVVGDEVIATCYESGEIDGSGLFIVGSGREMERRVIGTARTVTVRTDGFTVPVNSATPTGLPLIIAFERGTGQFLQLNAAGELTAWSSGSTPRIILGNTPANQYIIDLTPFTGRHEVRKG